MSVKINKIIYLREKIQTSDFMMVEKLTVSGLYNVCGEVLGVGRAALTTIKKT